MDVDLAFGDDGLVPAIAQDADSGEVLMLAYASPAAVERTVETGLAHYHSRSRGELWRKGEDSGHVQHVREVRVDCDGDALLYVVDQAGGACHTGHRSCFYRAVAGIATANDGGEGDGPSLRDDASEGDRPSLRLDAETVGEEVFDPDAVYE